MTLTKFEAERTSIDKQTENIKQKIIENLIVRFLIVEFFIGFKG